MNMKFNSNMKLSKLQMNSSGEKSGEVYIKRGILSGNSLTSLLFVSRMVPLTAVTRQQIIQGNHLLFLDDLKLF